MTFTMLTCGWLEVLGGPLSDAGSEHDMPSQQCLLCSFAVVHDTKLLWHSVC